MKTLSILTLCFSLILCGCGKKNDPAPSVTNDSTATFPGKTVLFLDSYHESYEPNMKARTALERELKGSGVTVLYRYLDEKNNSDTAFLRQRGIAISREIDSIQPDIIVLADDPIMKWVAEPFLIAKSTPLIFIGVNWQYPKVATAPLTGQLEVELLTQLIDDLKTVGKGSRIGILTAKTGTDEKSIAAYRDVLGVEFTRTALVTTFEEWKREFRQLQKEVDILIVRQNAGITGWNDHEAELFCRMETKIPTGSPNFHMSRFVLLCYPKLNEEFGEYAGKTVLKILKGATPHAMAYDKNSRTNRTVNAAIAKQINVLFPAEFLETAHFVESLSRKIAFVNSYHRGYEWSDKIEQSFLQSFGVADSAGKSEYRFNGMEIRFFYLDGKQNPQDEKLKIRASETVKLLNQWKPDLIVAADDDASKFLIQPHYSNTETPVLYCGLNWDASAYGFPTPNIRGMVEVAPVRELIDFLTPLAKGKRIGYIGADVLSESKELNHYKTILNIEFHDGGLVKSINEWKTLYRRLQKSCDMVIVLSYVGIHNWDIPAMEKFVIEETKVPSGTTTQMVRRLALVSFTRLPEEQGWWVGTQARAVLSGTAMSSIVSTHNVRSAKYVHTELMKKLAIKIPTHLIDSVFLLE